MADININTGGKERHGATIYILPHRACTGTEGEPVENPNPFGPELLRCLACGMVGVLPDMRARHPKSYSPREK